MSRTIMPIGYRKDSHSESVFCMICGSDAAKSWDSLPHCARCGSSYCPACMTAKEPSLQCGGDATECDLRLPAHGTPVSLSHIR